MKNPQPNKKTGKKKAKSVKYLEQLPKEIEAEPGRAVKFVLWLFMSRREVTLTGVGPLDAV